jgi:MerR HTH family regulatory protein
LTNPVGHWNIQMKKYSTIQVAKILDIGTDTLHRWMREGLVPTPPLQSIGGMSVRLWTEDDLAKAKKYKADRYWGKGGRKKRKKARN